MHDWRMRILKRAYCLDTEAAQAFAGSVRYHELSKACRTAEVQSNPLPELPRLGHTGLPSGEVSGTLQ